MGACCSQYENDMKRTAQKYLDQIEDLYSGCEGINSYDIFSQKHFFYEAELPGQVNWKDTVPFIPPITKGKVIKVYDGDTITIACRLPFEGTNEDPIYRFNVRLLGINCPEMKGKNREEKNAAIFVQQTLENLILHKYVELKNISLEKYGRLLANVEYRDSRKTINLSRWLVVNRYATPYDGGTKKVPKHWKKYMRTGNFN